MEKHEDVLEAERRIRRAIVDDDDTLDLSELKGLTSLSELDVDIAEVKSVTRLDLGQSQVHDLSPIAGMNQIRSLSIERTPITDITPIASLIRLNELNLDYTIIEDFSAISQLTTLQNIYLEGTKFHDLNVLPSGAVFRSIDLMGSNVADLRPAARLKLDNYVSNLKLRVTNTPAALADPRIAKIDAMTNDFERVAKLLEYVTTLPPDEVEDTDLFPSDVVNGKLETAQSTPTEEEVDDTLKQTIHQRLIGNAANLADAAQNQYGKTYQKAKLLNERLKRPMADLDMVNIHLDIEALRSLKERGAEGELSEPFSQTVLDAFDEVLLSGPGLTLDNPDVEKLMGRIRRFEAAPPPADTQEKHDALSTATAQNADAIGDNLRALEKRVIETETPAEKLAVQEPAHRGMLVRIGRLAVAGTKETGKVVAAALAVHYLTPPIISYISANFPILWDVAALYGVQFQAWFGMALSEVKELAGPLAAVDYLPKQRSDEKDY